MVRKNQFLLFMTILLSIFILSSCGEEASREGNTDHENQNNKPEEVNEPENNNEANEEVPEIPEMPDEEITLIFKIPWGEEMFDELIKDAVEETYPNITLENVGGAVDAEGLEENFAEGIVPDIMLAHNGFDILYEADAAYPLDELIELHQTDLSRFREGLIDIVKARDPEGSNQIYGLPFEDFAPVLFYNKDIFDQFGVDYPTDGMTWDEVIDLAKEVSGERDGTEYRGLAFQTSWHYSFALSQLSPHGTDPETGEVLFSEHEEFRKFIDLFDELRSIPGNEENIVAGFMDQNVAMTLQHLNEMKSYSDAGLNFDIVSFPVWSEKPDAGPVKFIGQTLAINKHSEHKTAAYKVIELLTSAEKQTENVRLGRISPLADFDVMSEFLRADLPDHEYNLEGALALGPAEPPVYTEWGPYIQWNPNDFYNEIILEHFESGDDPITTLRKMEETYQAIVDEEKARR